MSRPINASLFVPFFEPTANVGEYTFVEATFDNQADATGNGALDAAIGAVIYIQATDANTGSPVSGVMHRYKITSIQAASAQQLSATILWDEDVADPDLPTNSSYCLYAEASNNLRYGLVPSDIIYSSLPPGSSIASMVLDIRDITDPLVAPPVVSEKLKLTGTTTDDTYQDLIPVTDHPVIADNTAAIYKVLVMGHSSSQNVAFEFTGMMSISVGASSVQLVNQPIKTIVASSDLSLDARIIADLVNGGIGVQVKGLPGSTLSWVSSVELLKS